MFQDCDTLEFLGWGFLCGGGTGSTLFLQSAIVVLWNIVLQFKRFSVYGNYSLLMKALTIQVFTSGITKNPAPLWVNAFTLLGPMKLIIFIKNCTPP